ncbi:MAG: MobC family plasmid mobilization relaxosome protein [Ruminococcus sp.]|nr:MobC family plasmid mobilization relaxosome protein [Ruminococcus sp.]
MKNKKLSIRISEKDLQKIHQRADKARLSITDYVTQSCLGNQIIVVEGLDEVIRQQKALGRNLNQLTTLCNMGKVSFSNLDKLVDECVEINKTLSKLLQRRRWSG